ncbi:MAG: hypothetical protein MUC81_11905 [Bacteroidia bacterium]|jgi:hypothetical protein|nr:hypothetical protein [Bacteroidia bacterium]
MLNTNRVNQRSINDRGVYGASERMMDYGFNAYTKQAGLPNKHWIGPTLIALGSQTIMKPFSLGGTATKGTSVASIVMRKTFTYHSPAIKQITTNLLGRASSTASLGGALGRMVPIVGWGWTLFDATIWALKNGEYSDFNLIQNLIILVLLSDLNGKTYG